MEEISPYECGFNPHIQPETKFGFKLYIISTIFLIFNLGIALLIPISLLLLYIITKSTIIYVFLFVLIVGLVIEFEHHHIIIILETISTTLLLLPDIFGVQIFKSNLCIIITYIFLCQLVISIMFKPSNIKQNILLKIIYIFSSYTIIISCILTVKNLINLYIQAYYSIIFLLFILGYLIIFVCCNWYYNKNKEIILKLDKNMSLFLFCIQYLVIGILCSLIFFLRLSLERGLTFILERGLVWSCYMLIFFTIIFIMSLKNLLGLNSGKIIKYLINLLEKNYPQIYNFIIFLAQTPLYGFIFLGICIAVNNLKYLPINPTKSFKLCYHIGLQSIKILSSWRTLCYSNNKFQIQTWQIYLWIYYFLPIVIIPTILIFECVVFHYTYLFFKVLPLFIFPFIVRLSLRFFCGFFCTLQDNPIFRYAMLPKHLLPTIEYSTAEIVYQLKKNNNYTFLYLVYLNEKLNEQDKIYLHNYIFNSIEAYEYYYTLWGNITNKNLSEWLRFYSISCFFVYWLIVVISEMYQYIF